jgi:hypothetical protein
VNPRALSEFRGDPAYVALGQPQKSLEDYNRALPIDRRAGDRDGEAAVLNNIGNVRSALGEKQKAPDN